MKSAPISVQISCHGWDTELEKDILLPSTHVVIWAHIGGSTAKSFEKKLTTPIDLWEFLRELSTDFELVMKREFNYIPPVRRSGLPTNLGDLFT